MACFYGGKKWLNVLDARSSSRQGKMSQRIAARTAGGNRRMEEVMPMPICEKCWSEAGLISAGGGRSQTECYFEILAMRHKHNNDINLIITSIERGKPSVCEEEGGDADA
jgi:hypothetical protein